MMKPRRLREPIEFFHCATIYSDDLDDFARNLINDIDLSDVTLLFMTTSVQKKVVEVGAAESLYWICQTHYYWDSI